MTRALHLLVAHALLLVGSSPSLAHAEGASCGAPPPDRSVIIVGIDGLSPRGLDAGQTPHLNRLLRRGSYTFHARGVLPTSSSPNWGSMITGAAPTQHGITSNAWQPWNRAIEPAGIGPGDIFPTIFAWTRAQRPDAVIGVVYDWGGFGRLFERSVVDLDANTEGPEKTMARAIEFFAQADPDLLFIHLDHVDGAGHAHGWHTPKYYDAVRLADELIGDLIDAIESARRWDSTVVIVTSDHGGVGRSHGGESMAELEIPWVITGAGVASGREITRAVNTYDTACTAAGVLGVEPHPACVGRHVVEAMSSATSGRGYRNRPYVPAPRFEPTSGLFVADAIRVALDCEDPNAIIRYTLDGSTPTADSPRYAEPIELAGTTELRAASFRAGAPSRVATGHYRLISEDAPRPVEFAYYEGSWKRLPAFEELTPVRRGTAPEFGLRFIERREDHFGARFRAGLRIDEPGTYTFHLKSDDGSRLYVGSRRLIDNDGSHGPIEESGSIDLRPGVHEIVVEYFEDYGGETLEVAVTGPDKQRSPLSHDRLVRLDAED